MDRRRRFERNQSMLAADIGEIPEPLHPERREACRYNLHLFSAWYFPKTTGKSVFSPDHVQVIDRTESSLLHGGRYLNVVYRGFAKTSITEVSAIWAGAYGHRKFIPIFGAEESLAIELLKTIQSQLEENDRLCEDFPEICLPFRHLEGKNQRSSSQTHQGERTHIYMSKDRLVFPTIWVNKERRLTTPGSGTILRARGLLQGMRGMKYTRADGSSVRPDFALIDDPQTDESAASFPGRQKRLNIIRKAILKSEGHHGVPMACVVNGTPMEDDDVVEQLADQERNPAWQSVRIPMVKRWADEHEGLWQEYAKIRRSFNNEIPNDLLRARADSTEFYRQHREQMDAGCIVSWKGCHKDDELSAIQHAYNSLFDDGPEVFESECQCNPAVERPAGVEKLDSLTIARRVNGSHRSEVPASAAVLTAFIDVHDDVLYWAVVAWTQTCTGYIVDYGTWPDQKKSYFSKRQATATIKRKFKGQTIEACRVAALEALVEQLCGQEWKREDGSICRIDKLLIDAGYAPDQVELVCRRSKYAATLQMSRGKGYRAGDKQIRDYQRKPGWRFGDKLGPGWFIPAGQKRTSRVLWFDSNAFKTWVHARLATPVAAEGSLSLFGVNDERTSDHRLFADHLTAEIPTEASSKGLTLIEWANPPGRDNHWLDCVVGCAVAALLLGCSLVTVTEEKKLTRRERALAAAKKRGLSA